MKGEKNHAKEKSRAADLGRRPGNAQKKRTPKEAAKTPKTGAFLEDGRTFDFGGCFTCVAAGPAWGKESQRSVSAEKWISGEPDCAV